ncbi:hypothetical protein JCM15831A_27440 [Asaia astilbis]
MCAGQEAATLIGEGDKGSAHGGSGFLDPDEMGVAITIGHSRAPESEINQLIIVANGNACLTR